MYKERKEDLSIYYWLQSKLPSFFSVVDGFPDTPLSTPTVSIEWDKIHGYELELGTRVLAKERIWYFDIFAKNKSQRDETSFLIFNELQYGIPVYDYDMGFPPLVTNQTKLGTIIPVQIDIQNLHKQIEEKVDTNTEEIFYRAVVIFTATFDTF